MSHLNEPVNLTKKKLRKGYSVSKDFSGIENCKLRPLHGRTWQEKSVCRTGYKMN